MFSPSGESPGIYTRGWEPRGRAPRGRTFQCIASAYQPNRAGRPNAPRLIHPPPGLMSAPTQSTGPPLAPWLGPQLLLY